MSRKTKPKLTVTVTLASGEEYKASGNTIHEALNALDLDYTRVKTKGEVSLSVGKLKSSKFFYLRPLRRLVSSKMRKAQVGRDLMDLLK